MKRTAVWDFLLGRPVTVLLTVAVTVSSLLLDGNIRIVAATSMAIALVTHSTISWTRDRSNARRMNQQYASILERLLQLLSDLGDLTGQDHGLWRIEVYVQRSDFALSFSRPLLRKQFMVPTLSLALKHAPLPSPSISLDHELFGACFRRLEPCLWWNEELAPFGSRPDVPRNKATDISDDVNEDLRRRFGSISVNPIVDQLGARCRGLLVVHTPIDAAVVTKAVGALLQERAKRRVSNACRDLHSRLEGE